MKKVNWRKRKLVSITYKFYLSEKEDKQLNRIVTMYLDYAEVTLKNS